MRYINYYMADKRKDIMHDISMSAFTIIHVHRCAQLKYGHTKVYIPVYHIVQ